MRVSTNVLWAASIVTVALVVMDRDREHRKEIEALKAAIANSDHDSSASASSIHADTIRAVEQVRLAVRSAASEPVANDPPPDPESAKRNETDNRKKPRLTVEQVQNNVLNAYAKEAFDPTWSSKASRDLDSTIREALPEGSRLLSIECRTTLCVVEVEHKTASRPVGWLDAAFQKWPGAMMVGGEREERGSFVETLIPIRENTVPPYEGQ